MEYWFSTYDIAKLAAEVESKGIEFYRHLQAISPDRKMSDMAAFFAEQEEQHKAKFLAMAEADESSVQEHAYSVDIRAMMKASIRGLERFFDARSASGSPPVSVSECLEVAAELEATSVSTYARMLKVHTGQFHELLGNVLGEEVEHLRMIRSVQRQLGLLSDGVAEREEDLAADERG